MVYTYIYIYGIYMCVCIYIYTHTHKAIQLRFKLPTHCNLIGRSVTTQPLCYRPAVFSRHLRLIVLSLPQRKIRRTFQKRYFLFFTLSKKRVSRRVPVSDCGSQEFFESRDHAVATLCFRNFPASNVLLQIGYSDLGRLWFSSVFPSKCPDSTLD
jgi:hypothetical protein